MSTGRVPVSERPPGMRRARLRCLLGTALTGGVAVLAAASAQAAITCEREISANVVAFDKPIMYNRLGAGNVNGMMYALKRDVVNTQSNLPLTAGGAAVPGQLDLRPDKRHRPIVLRVRVGDCLTVNFQNLVTPIANPFPPTRRRSPRPASSSIRRASTTRWRNGASASTPQACSW